MIYFNLENGYESFKELFGQRKTENGDMVRKNKVLLNVWKDMFRNKQGNPEIWSAMYLSKSMKQPMCQEDLIRASKHIRGGGHENLLMEGNYMLSSDEYRVDSEGLCYDGDIKSIRYDHNDHIYKMKASKFFAKIWDEHNLSAIFGTKAQIFCGEKFAEAWCAYAEGKVGKDLYTLHVGSEPEDFKRIYSSENDLSSCMRNKNQWRFYVDAVDASAAWLEDKDGVLVCRCVIFNDCTQISTGKKFRLAERQYAIHQDDKLKNILVQRLYAEGRIDAHKRVGASCWDHDNYVDRNGNDLDDTCFSIKCQLDYGDTLSFQDSFAYFYYDLGIAYDYEDSCYTDKLDVTDSVFHEGDEGYDEWEDEFYRGEEMYEAYWHDCNGDIVSGRVASCNIDRFFIRVDRGRYYGDYLNDDIVVRIDGEDWYMYDDDVVEIDGEYYEKGCGCEYCKDICEYAADYIEWNGGYYANYTYSELLGKDVPDDLLDEVEQEYADKNGYTKDVYGAWVKVGETETIVA